MRRMLEHFPKRIFLHSRRLTLTGFMQSNQSSTFTLLFKKLCVSQFKETQMAKPSVVVHSGNVSRLTTRTANEIYLRLTPTVSVLRILHSLIIANVTLKTMSALTAEIQIANAPLTGRRTGVKMTTRDCTFDSISQNKHLELAETSSGRKKLHHTPHTT